MKLKFLKSRWGRYFLFFYLFVFTVTVDAYFYGDWAFMKSIPYNIEDTFFLLAFFVGILVEDFSRYIPDFLDNEELLIPLIFLANSAIYYFAGSILEKMWRKIFKHTSN